jgi:phosphatidylglycerophosphatase A
MDRPSLLPVIIGTGFGSGFWPWGPGTAGALLATIVWLGLSCVMPSYTMLITLSLCVIFMAIGTCAIKQLTPFWGDDPARVVIDEIVGVWIPLLVAPIGNIWYALAAFLLFRFFDIVKPLGIRNLDRRVGAFWVMADDILAGIYSGVLIAAYRWII